MKPILEVFEENLKIYEQGYNIEKRIVVGLPGTKLVTYAIGNMEVENGRKIHLAAKKDNTDVGIDLKDRFLKDLWAIDKIDSEDREFFGGKFRKCLPQLYALEIDQDGNPLVIVSEDFTKRNRYNVLPVDFGEIFPRWPVFFQDVGVDIEDLCRLAIKVNDKIKYVDFETKVDSKNVSRFEKILEKLTIAVNVIDIG